MGFVPFTTAEPDELEILEAEVERQQRTRRRKRHDAAPCPRTSPVLHIFRFERGAQFLRFDHTDTPVSAVRPYGAEALQLFVAKTIERDAPLADLQLVGHFKRKPIRVEFGPDDDRRFATYYARWVDRNGDTGPWSLPVCMRIAA